MGSVGSSSHLDFEKLPLRKGEKLHRYRVFNHDLYETIGEIHWRGGWMQYVFQAITHRPADIVEIDGKKYVPLDCVIAIDMSRGCHGRLMISLIN